MEDINLMTVNDVQKKLGIGRDAAYRLMKNKKFPSIRIGARYYITEAALIEWYANQQRRTY